MCLVIGSAAVGALITAVAGNEPGVVLGLCVVAGTVAAALAVQPRAVYRIIPVPALAYLVAAVLAGMIHDRANGTSSTALAVGATQWIASGFVAMSVATILAIVMTAVRWPRKKRGPDGPAGRLAGERADGSRRGQATRGSTQARGSSEPRGRRREADYLERAAVRQRPEGIRGG